MRVGGKEGRKEEGREARRDRRKEGKYRYGPER
jgi:hypothetical protein